MAASTGSTARSCQPTSLGHCHAYRAFCSTGSWTAIWCLSMSRLALSSTSCHVLSWRRGRTGHASPSIQQSIGARVLRLHKVLLDRELNQLRRRRDVELGHHPVLVKRDSPRGDLQHV